MKLTNNLGAITLAIAMLTGVAGATDNKINLSKEQPGKPPATFEPMVGTWVIAEDSAEKVIMVDGRPWVASKDNPSKLLIESARKLYGMKNEELMTTPSSSPTIPWRFSRV